MSNTVASGSVASGRGAVARDGGGGGGEASAARPGSRGPLWPIISSRRSSRERIFAATSASDRAVWLRGASTSCPSASPSARGSRSGRDGSPSTTLGERDSGRESGPDSRSSSKVVVMRSARGAGGRREGAGRS